MPDWTKSMQQIFKYYIVDPSTWKDKEELKNVKSCSINRDDESDTLGSATIDVDETLGESYVRIYMITIQNGIEEKHPLGTFLVQTPSSKHDGKVRTVSMDAYTPLLELKESPPPLGYSLFKGENIMDIAYNLCYEHVRCPVVKTKSEKVLLDDFVSDINDTWLSFVKDLILNANFKFSLDELGRVLFAPKQDTSSLQPIWDYNDDNSSILYSEINMSHDLYGIPNVVEVIYSNGSDIYNARVVNDDENSPISTINRGREIIYRDTNPSLSGNSTESQIKEYAEQLLRDLSSIEYTISYTHGYCPVRIGDCVRLNYTRAGFTDIKAKVISQSIKCEPGCPVSEKAVYTAKLWR